MSSEREELRQLIQDLPEVEVPAALGGLWPRLRAGKNRPLAACLVRCPPGHTSDAAARTEERLQDRFAQT